MHTYLYIHGYGSTGNAQKAQTLKQMFPTAKVITPTFDYDTESPYKILQQLQTIVKENHVELIIGSSTGGYFALCCCTFFKGPIWAINPVRDIILTFHRLFTNNDRWEKTHLDEFQSFDKEVFQTLQPEPKQFNFALSADDELLGDHSPLLQRFPQHNYVVILNHCGHGFTRFRELKSYLVL